MGARCFWCGFKLGRCYEHGTDECGCIKHDCAERDHWLEIEDSAFAE